MATPSRRVLILGLDGGTFDLLDPWFKAGELPFLRGLAERGFRSPLVSVYPAKTIPAWYCFATGQDPGSLGVFGFTEPNGGPGKSRIVQTFRPAEALWDRLSRYGVTVGVLNFPVRAGYAINGFVVPGMLSDSPPTFPANLRGELETLTNEPHVPELPPYRDSDRERWIGLATRAIEQYGRYAEILCDRFRPSLLFTLLRETDRVEHQHWAELMRPFEEIGEDLKRFWRTVDRTCEQIEKAFRSIGGPELTFVISDHGHGLARSDFFTNRWLAQEGYLRFKRPKAGWHRRAAARALLASERYRVTRRLVRAAADRLRGGRGRAWVGKVVAGEGSFESMAENIDWDRTVAFSYPIPEGIYINRYHPDLSEDAAAKAIAEIRQKLEAIQEARIEVFEPSEIYQGKNLAQAPALLLRIDGLATEPRMDFSYPDPMLLDRPSYFYGSGVHRMDGILIVAGDGVAPGQRGGPFSLLDVAPTVLETMGYPTPPAMAGHSFGPAFSTPAPTVPS
ncbi:MAG: alkaline phosphatase family protein [Thermoplasmata archaeon]|nr:alkaline phosphatase family protein [Thermoplasmata archaeon]MCI4359881.1 alkaline phosphatase family protein [Thermoplasmata archaeon]